MFSTFALLIMLTLSNGEQYTPQVAYYDGFTNCMDRAMVVTDTYRKSDLKKYTVKCIKVTPAFITND